MSKSKMFTVYVVSFNRKYIECIIPITEANNLTVLTVYMTHAPVAIQRVKHELRSTRLHIHRGMPMKRATKIYCQRLPNIFIFTGNEYFVNLLPMT